MKWICMIVMASLVIIASVQAQPDTLWTKVFGGAQEETGFVAQQTADGGFIFIGQTCSYGAGEEDAFLLKTNEYGMEQWHHTYGGPFGDECYDVYQTPDGGYIFGGRTGDDDVKDFWVVRTNSTGDTLWTRTYGGTQQDEAFVFIETNDGGYLLAGHTESYGAGDRDVWMVKINATGDTLWTAVHDFGGDNIAYSAKQTSDGGYILVGFNDDDMQMLLLKTDNTGHEQWHRTYTAGFMSMLKSVQQTDDGGYILAGYVYYLNAEYLDVHIVRTNANGDTLWTRTYGGDGADQIWNSCRTLDGNYLFVGNTVSFGADSTDFLMMEMNDSGNLLWTNVIGSLGNEIGTNITALTDGGYIATGAVLTGQNALDAWLLRFGPDMKVIEPETVSPITCRLAPAYPNPFNPVTTLRFEIPVSGKVTLVVYNIMGQEVARLVDGFRMRGGYDVRFEARDLSSGIYFAQMTAGDFRQIRKLLLLK